MPLKLTIEETISDWKQVKDKTNEAEVDIDLSNS
jgi:hypothetical protein